MYLVVVVWYAIVRDFGMLAIHWYVRISSSSCLSGSLLPSSRTDLNTIFTISIIYLSSHCSTVHYAPIAECWLYLEPQGWDARARLAFDDTSASIQPISILFCTTVLPVSSEVEGDVEDMVSSAYGKPRTRVHPLCADILLFAGVSCVEVMSMWMGWCCWRLSSHVC